MIKSLRTITKKGMLYTAAFVLAIGSFSAAVPFMAGERVDAVGVQDGHTWRVSTLEGLKDALATKNHITLDADIKTDKSLLLTRSNVTINGNNHTITGPDLGGVWVKNGDNFSLKIYRAQNVKINSLRVTGANAGIQVNDSQVELRGHTWVGGNLFGGIEVSNGSASLLHQQGSILNATEAYGKPTIWSDTAATINSTATPLTMATHVKSGQAQYYLNAQKANIVATNVTQKLTYSDAQVALDAAVDGDTVRLDANVVLDTNSLRFVKAGVTLNGNNKTVTATFPGVNKTANASVVYVNAERVTISSLTVAGPADTTNLMHGIQVYETSGVTLNDVTVKNSTKTGLLVNGSQVTVTNLTTENNAWTGVNVDNANAHLTVMGVSTHNEPATAYAHIFVDSKDELNNGTVKISDVSQQYAKVDEGAGYAFFLDKQGPEVATAINKTYNPTSVVVTASDDQALSRIDISLRLDNGTVVTKWWGEYVTSKTKSYDLSADIAALNLADGSYTVRATVVDAAGKAVNSQNKSFIIDHKKPSVTASMSDVLIGLNDALPTVTVSANDANGISKVQYKIVRADDESSTVAGWVDVTNGVESEVDAKVSTLDDGNYILVARAYDNAQNKQSGVKVAFTIDRTAPVVTIPDYSAQGNAITPNTTSDDTNATYSWALVSGNSAGLAPFDGNVLAPLFTVLLDGTYELALTTTDIAGNTTVTPFSFTYTTPVVPATTFTGEEGTGTPITQPVGGFSNVLADATPISEVLGVETENEATQEVKGATTESVAQAVNTDKENSIGSLAWYWWVIIAAAAISLIWWIIAAARRRNSEA